MISTAELLGVQRVILAGMQALKKDAPTSISPRAIEFCRKINIIHPIRIFAIDMLKVDSYFLTPKSASNTGITGRPDRQPALGSNLVDETDYRPNGCSTTPRIIIPCRGMSKLMNQIRSERK